MRTLQLLLSVALYTSLLFGLEILLMDRYLWTTSPSHAFGLVIFVGVDAILLIVMYANTGLASIGALAASLIQLVLMIGDLTTGRPVGVSAETFRDYLLTNIGFLSLIVGQSVTLVLAIITIVLPHFHLPRVGFLKTR